MAIGERLDVIRRQRGMSQKQLADKLGMKPQALNKILLGKVQDPGFDTVARIADVLGVKLDDVLRLERDAAWRDLHHTEVIDDVAKAREEAALAALFRDVSPTSAELFDERAAEIVARLEKATPDELDQRVVERRYSDQQFSFGGDLHVVEANPQMVGRRVEAHVAAGAGGWDESTAPDEVVMLPSILFGPDDYLVQARGDSMIDEGITDGDYLIVQRRPSGIAAHGELVIAWLNEGLVIKRWYRRGGKKFLESSNEELGWKPREITAADVFEIQAVVKHIVKQATKKAKGAESRLTRHVGPMPGPINTPRKKTEDDE
jgi:SOS-response transcriptional repressor LexA